MLLTSLPDSPRPPQGRDLYAWQFRRNAADPLLRQVAVPEALSAGADCGLILLSDRPEAVRFAMFLLSRAGQAILDRHGFTAPGLPAR